MVCEYFPVKKVERDFVSHPGIWASRDWLARIKNDQGWPGGAGLFLGAAKRISIA